MENHCRLSCFKDSHSGLIQFWRPPLAPKGAKILRDSEFAIIYKKVISRLTWFFHLRLQVSKDFEIAHIHLSVCVNVHVSAAYSATLQTKHFIILFFSSSFILPVNNFFSRINTFFAFSIKLLRISFVRYPSSGIKLHKYLNWLALI